MVDGNFNADLSEPEGNTQDKEIVEDLTTTGLEYMSAHFLSRHKSWERDGRTWNIIHKGKGCSPGHITFWVRTTICSITSPPRTLSTTQTIIWSWVVSAYPRWQSTPDTWDAGGGY